MITKQVIKDKEKIMAGLNKAADVVKSTMGGQGKTVIISNNDDRDKLRFTKDGVSVAKAIKLDDPIENIGAQILISAAQKTVELCGDGTTLTSVLLQTLINETITYINKTKDVDINKLIRELEDSVAKVISYLNENSNTVDNLFHVKSIASTSANSMKIGRLFEEIYKETGFDALVTLEKSEYSSNTYYEISKGIIFDSNTGWAHSSFMTNKDTEQAVYEDAYIHIDEDPISRLTPEYSKLLGLAIEKDVPLVIMAPRFSDSFIRVCSMQKVNQGAPICLVKLPGFGNGIKKNLEDIKAFLTSENYVDKIVVDAYKFILYNEDTPYLNDRVESLKQLRDSAVEWFDEKDYNERIYNLKGATAVIYAGGKTPEAQSEEYDRLEDAIGAVTTAVKNGFVEGGGLALFKAAATLNLHKIIRNACFVPMVQILNNANISKDTNVDMTDIKGFNVKTMQYEDFLDSGIIDPTNVIITALQNALANTILLINTAYTLYNEFKN